MCAHFNHRAAGVVINRQNLHRQNQAEYSTNELLRNPQYVVLPSSWVSSLEVKKRTLDSKPYYLGIKSVTSPTNTRTFIASYIPASGVGNSFPIINLNSTVENQLMFYSYVSTLIFDFICKQKVGGVNLNFFYINQFPILTPESFPIEFRERILVIVTELIYSSWDIKVLIDKLWESTSDNIKDAILKHASELEKNLDHDFILPQWQEAYPETDWELKNGIPLQPFKWDNRRRVSLIAELNALVSLSMGLTKFEVECILDPSVLLGEDYPSNHFSGFKNQEVALYGEYLSKRLIIEFYDKHSIKFNIEAQIKKLEETWAKYQIDNTPTETRQHSTSTVSEPSTNFNQTSMF
jgi:hypothetical protein